RVMVAGLGEVAGTVRLVSPEVDRSTRLGQVRIFLGNDPGLRVGAFARASIVTARSTGLAVPTAAVLQGSGGPIVRVVEAGRVASRRINSGLTYDGLAEGRAGLSEGELVVARTGTYLRAGDTVRPVLAKNQQPEVTRRMR